MHPIKSTKIVVVILAVLAGRAAASPITIYETIQGATGNLDGTVFSNKTLTLTFRSDNSVVTHSMSLYTIPVTSANVSVTGGGADILTDTFNAFVNQSAGKAGIADVSNSEDLFDVTDVSFDSYSFQGSIGPNSGTVTDGTGGSISTPTALGALTVTGFSSTGFYQAVVTPEPATLCILAMPLSLLLRRGRRNVAARH